MVIDLCAAEMLAVKGRLIGKQGEALKDTSNYVAGREKAYQHLAIYLSGKLAGYEKALRRKEEGGLELTAL